MKRPANDSLMSLDDQSRKAWDHLHAVEQNVNKLEVWYKVNSRNVSWRDFPRLREKYWSLHGAVLRRFHAVSKSLGLL